jgi:hypothetical protein
MKHRLLFIGLIIISLSQPLAAMSTKLKAALGMGLVITASALCYFNSKKIINYWQKQINHDSLATKAIATGSLDQHLATGAREGWVDDVKDWLSQGANANYVDEDGYTPLHWAANRGQAEVVSILLKHGANFKTKSKSDQTALDLAQRKNHHNVIHLLKLEGVKGKRLYLTRILAAARYDQTGLTELQSLPKPIAEHIAEYTFNV